MSALPITNDPGFRVDTLTATSTPVPIPDDATSVYLWFVDADGAPAPGRYHLTASDDPITVVDDDDATLAHHPAGAVEHGVESVRSYGQERSTATHLHLASTGTGVVAYGTWLRRV